ncbi:MAG: SDR family NAD(P)-dependent oxidoreductase [Flavobacteriaceae bacterium]|nr:SDR family NAD(P)-dependent oxidoreductase [Flavobacteriaceae bacterium]
MKTALITGGTSGVGLSIVKQLVQHNFNVFFIGTNIDKGLGIETELNKKNSTRSKFINLDLSDLTKVKEFIKQFKSVHNKLDLLLNVAGVMLLKQQETKQGYDKTFTIGYLSAFILSNELIPLLEKGTNSRIVNVSGKPSHIKNVKLDFNNLDFKKNYSGFKTAIVTIHAKTVLTEILSEKLIDKNIDVNAFHPGIVKSDLAQNMPLILKVLAKIMSPLMAKESKNGIYTSTSKEIIGITGKLFVNKKPVLLNFDEIYKAKLWTATKEMIKQKSKIYPTLKK